jgi:hypothetical protein
MLFLAISCVGAVCLYTAGCSDDPQTKAGKEMRNQTAEAVRKSVEKNEYKNAREQVISLLETNRSGGLTKDAALLASGNLALAQGQQMQSDVGLKILQIQQNVDELEKVLRSSERLLLERERIEKLLQSGDDKILELQKLLDGEDQKEGFNKQLELANAQMEQLLSQKDLVQTGKDHAQSILDEYQSNADDLKRQAELAKGNQRLDLEKQAFAVLEKRKDYYIKLQAAENELSGLNSDIALVQVRVDGLTRSVQDIRQQIESIQTSEARVGLKQQIQEIQKSIAGGQERLAAISDAITTGLAAYRQISDQICAVYDDAIAEFTKVASGDAAFTATVQLADSAHYAALAASRYMKTQKYLADRLGAFLETVDPEFKSELQNKLQIKRDIDADYTKKTFAYFDRSIEAYKKALGSVTGLSRNLGAEDQSKMQNAKCSLLKSELLTLYSKMQFADSIEAFDLADAAEAAKDEVIQEGTKLGVCFTQSEAMQIVGNEGLNYAPSLPLNMEVFIEGKKQEFSTWKRLPVSEREAQVDKDVQQIDNLIAQYGQEVASQLEPLKQEMLTAKERGFKEAAAGTSSRPGEPNSLY